MKIATIILRLLLGALMVFGAVSYFFKIGEQPVPSGEMAKVMTGFMATKYLFPLVKVIELLTGICLIAGKFMKISVLFLLPISVNIFLIHLFLEPEDLAVGGFIIVANLFLIYTNRESYKGLFTA